MTEKPIFKYSDELEDTRANCYSVFLKVSIKDYLKFIHDVYENKGTLEGQRSALKTKSAQRIRKRLVEDLVKGSVIPPIVLGLKLNNSEFENLKSCISDNIEGLLEDVSKDQISIIDGMQRTTALLEASFYPSFDQTKKIRIELWIAESTNSLIYRMLVLNTGQIPWNIRRQLEVVFSQFKKELVETVHDLTLFTTADGNNRTDAGQYQASEIIELFMLFSTKRVNIDIREQLAEEFARLDIIETSGNQDFMKNFMTVLSLLVKLDIAFTLLKEQVDLGLIRFKTGKSIFTSQPARAGFIVAASQYIYGLPGIEFNYEVQQQKSKKLVEGVTNFISFLETQNSLENLTEIIDLQTLDELLTAKVSSKIGEFERNFFWKSFDTFINLAIKGELNNLTPCWRAYQ